MSTPSARSALIGKSLFRVNRKAGSIRSTRRAKRAPASASASTSRPRFNATKSDFNLDKKAELRAALGKRRRQFSLGL